MDKFYNFASIETKWNAIWENKPVNIDGKNKKKFYCLDMFPYPSASGLHVGHWRGYVISDVLSRIAILRGYFVLHPMGFDAFGLPAENYAIKIGEHPSKTIEDSIVNVKRQLKDIGSVYDWDREINTTNPDYYKWTQWIFIQMYKRGLAYEKEMPLNWCPECKCVLANEEAVGGRCDRCKSIVTKKMLRQWMLKITEYADRLLEDLKDLDWPEKVKKMQADWIGKSVGTKLVFAVSGEYSVEVFTTRPDTIYGATFIVMSPEHELAQKIITDEYRKVDLEYIDKVKTRSAVDRMSDKDKSGVFTGSYAINPLNNKKMPIWLSDYVLSDYGTGAIMCVPAHDRRDYDFAKKYDLEIIQVISNSEQEMPYEGVGELINSDQFDGMGIDEAKVEITNYLEQLGVGKETTNYKLRDWVFSRQRYWGEPIPIVHCERCGASTVDEKDLPVILPKVDSYMPTDTGESPLSKIEYFVNTTCPKCGGSAKRETNTMPQWAGSSWYFLRYVDSNNDNMLADKEALKKWLPVDYYVGGIEHAVLHLLYSRFYTKFLYDIGVVDFKEPFLKLFNQGMINRNGMKMSKSKGNVVSPDDLVKKYGIDSLRMYELFIGPSELDSEWDDSGIEGVYRYLNKLWSLVFTYKDNFIEPTEDTISIKNILIRDVVTRIDNLNFNTVISSFMENTNKIINFAKIRGVDKETVKTIVILIAPFAPYMAEELWSILGYKESVFLQSMPSYDLSKIKEDTVKVAIQVNGKLKATLEMVKDMAESEAVQLCEDYIRDKLINSDIKRKIYVKNKIVNFVV
jgi:leucyl-tRNA synthetase